ncbi:MAG: hypothetical protein LIO54_08475 [Oscillospiraceae bacterium]|nr:hypothetical protein [Oscillospiraceae bacterium]
MAVAIITKSEERRAHEEYVARSFGLNASSSKERLEASEHVAARTREAYNQLKKMEGR